MIVTLAGASGSGKTTLAKALAKHFGWEFRENSAGLIIAQAHKDHMSKTWGYDGGWGQTKVINESTKDPNFGSYFQWAIQAARRNLVTQAEASGKNAIYDRGPLDPMVFWMNQVSHNLPQEETEKFFQACIPAMSKVDLVIRVLLQNPDKHIENNGSRVNNFYFQSKIDILYDLAIHHVARLQQENPVLLYNHKINIHRTSTWDWDTRLKECIKKIESI